jgi:hypothetical protein
LNGGPDEPAVNGLAAFPAAGQPAAGRGAAFPGADVSAPSFDDEVDSAVSFEKRLVGKAVLAVALVLLVLAIRMYFGG